jgi:hypothetical protein
MARATPERDPSRRDMAPDAVKRGDDRPQHADGDAGGRGEVQGVRCQLGLLIVDQAHAAPQACRAVTLGVSHTKYNNYGRRYMRVAAKRRADGVYVAAGVELIEPEFRHNFGVRPPRIARLGERLGSETETRFRKATAHRDPYSVSYHRTLILKACSCSAVFVGDARASLCPACKREADLRSTRASVRRLRAKRRPPPNSAASAPRQCRRNGRQGFLLGEMPSRPTP